VQEEIVANRNPPRKHVERAQVVLAAAQRGTVQPKAGWLGSAVRLPGAGSSGSPGKAQTADKCPSGIKTIHPRVGGKCTAMIRHHIPPIGDP
jgi:hypothetical protein